MSEMASWLHIDGGYVYCTDKDVIAYHEKEGEGVRSIEWDNFVGHYGIGKVFGVNLDRYYHHEGFTEMPDVIKKSIFNGDMDKMIQHAGNLEEATPEFIPILRRLANRSENVRSSLQDNPYKNWRGKGLLSNSLQMKVGIENGFTGSTIGNLLRSMTCDEKSMMIALRGAQDYMDEYSDHHHYHNIIENSNVTKKVLKYMLDQIEHGDVQRAVKQRLCGFRTVKQRIIKVKNFKRLKTQTWMKGRVKVRNTVR